MQNVKCGTKKCRKNPKTKQCHKPKCARKQGKERRKNQQDMRNSKKVAKKMKKWKKQPTLLHRNKL